MTNDDLEEFNRYQDFISIELLKQLGWSINIFTSKYYQFEHGESLAGVEIKYDKKMAETGNLYFELYERHNKTQKFTPSGINRADNTIFWCIGNYNEAYIFVKSQLKYLCDNFEKNGFRKVENDTSIGVIIPVSYFEKHKLYVVKKLKFTGDEKCTK